MVAPTATPVTTSYVSHLEAELLYTFTSYAGDTHELEMMIEDIERHHWLRGKEMKENTSSFEELFMDSLLINYILNYQEYKRILQVSDLPYLGDPTVVIPELYNVVNYLVTHFSVALDDLINNLSNIGWRANGQIVFLDCGLRTNMNFFNM